MPGLEEMLSQAASGGGANLFEPVDEAEQAEAFDQLRRRVAAIEPPNTGKRPTFHRGEAVSWRPGYANKKPPRSGAFVVVEQLEQPVLGHQDKPGSPYYREPLDLVVGEIDADGDFMELYVDSRRMERVDPPAPAE